MPRELEPEMEAFLQRLFPNLDDELRGAAPRDIRRIEEIASRPLPRFYRWFLERMGADMGPLASPALDCSASRVLACYDQGVVQPDPRFLLIGYDTDYTDPQHLFYDLERQTRDDALVTEDREDEAYDLFATFREMIAWGKFSRWVLDKLPQKCRGFFDDDEGGDVMLQLDPLMTSMGFETPIPVSPTCALYEGPRSALSLSCSPSDYRPGRRFFFLGGEDEGSLRRLLGEITTTSSLSVDQLEWLPHGATYFTAP